MVDYHSTINPTKFETAEELATFLAESYMSDREWAGLIYDKHSCSKMLNVLLNENRKINYNREEYLKGMKRIKEKIIIPFWIKQLKQNYTFPLYFKRVCTYADGYSTYYNCSILSKKEYNDFLQNRINELQKEIKRLEDLREM
jgi:hypothetical protein